MTAKTRTPKIALVHQHPASGAVHALSSDGRTVYAVTLGDSPSCTCPAGRNGRRCYHVATALCRFPAFYRAPWAVVIAETDPEPPTPAAPAVIPSQTACICDLYPVDDCPCRQSLPAAA